MQNICLIEVSSFLATIPLHDADSHVHRSGGLRGGSLQGGRDVEHHRTGLEEDSGKKEACSGDGDEARMLNLLW